MLRQGDRLVGYLPKQPPAGKLDYRVVLNDGGRDVSLTGETPVVIRFKGHVPLGVLLAHVIVMFAAMLLSTRAGLAALDKTDRPRVFAFWTIVLLFVGGFVLGPLVQKLAFGTWWTGVPLGWDLTDNKTLIAMVIWIVALAAGRKGRGARGWILAASVLMLVVFLIPHSLLGSELKYPEAGTPAGNPPDSPAPGSTEERALLQGELDRHGKDDAHRFALDDDGLVFPLLDGVDRGLVELRDRFHEP